MQLHDRVLEGLADMVVGDNTVFPYRSSYYITKFFRQCDLPYARWLNPPHMDERSSATLECSNRQPRPSIRFYPTRGYTNSSIPSNLTIPRKICVRRSNTSTSCCHGTRYRRS